MVKGYLDILVVKKRTGETTYIKQEFGIPELYSNYISIGFNKQTTKIIVHARNSSTPENFYRMVLLTTSEVHTIRSTETLEAYFACRKSL